MIKVKYKKKKLIYKLIFGVIWLFIGVFTLLEKNEIYWTDYGFIILSVVYLISYFFQLEEQYLTIDNEFICLNDSQDKKFYLGDITSIEKQADEYILKTNEKVMILNIDLIDADSLEKIDKELEKIQLKNLNTKV
ncbi:hypothetical protein [Pseudofulvibacter geojedonensis]|uniref:Uncharacterized protein n=1 Tax=Pseudofulvibacter geojedonensis TaxID=1123758 RepID=A0ABW3HZV1_9FLAO